MATNRKRLGRGRVTPTDAKALWDAGRHVEAMLVNVFIQFADGPDGYRLTKAERAEYARLVAKRRR